MCIHCTVHVSKCCSELRFVCEFLKTYELHQSEIAFKMSCPDLIPPSAFACYVTVIMLLAVLTFWVQEQLYSCGALRLRCELSAYFVRCQLILWGVSLFCGVSAYFVTGCVRRVSIFVAVSYWMMDFVIICEHNIIFIICEHDIGFMNICEHDIGFIIICEQDIVFVIICEYDIGFLCFADCASQYIYLSN